MRKEPSITRPEFSGPPLPRGRLIFLPFVPVSELPGLLSRNASDRLTVGPGRLFYLKQAAVLRCGPGAPAGLMGLEKIRSLGLKEILLLSYCGSLSPELRIGQAFLPDKALSQEGTARHYARSWQGFYFSSLTTLNNLRRFLKRKNLNWTEGAIVSTDAPYRETTTWMKKLQRKKIMAVDMEMSAVMSFAAFYRLRAAALFIVSDELFSGRWTDGSQSPQVQAATAGYFYPLIFES
ncbi:MAG: hypothetical protein QME85_09105 [Candidatus Saccharicenans sp.]|nr:hypothetical protein [Candidatus Saccharicenans sp.]